MPAFTNARQSWGNSATLCFVRSSGWEGSVPAGAEGENVPACGYLRAADTDRERMIDALKAAFARGRLTKDQFDAGVGQALTSRTYAELAAAGSVTARARGREHATPATPQVLARQVTRGASVARTMQARQWPTVLVAGLILVIVGVTLVPSESRPGWSSWD